MKLITQNSKIPEVGYSYNDLQINGTNFTNKYVFLFLVNYTLLYRYLKHRIIKFTRLRIFFSQLEYLFFNYSLKKYKNLNSNFKYFKGVFKEKKLCQLRKNLLAKKYFKNVYDISNLIPKKDITNYPNVWNFENDILSEDVVFELFSNKKIISHAKSLIGKNACISSIWAWHSFQTDNVEYNQNGIETFQNL